MTSIGPPTGNMNFHAADLQILSWDPLARRWAAIFDAEKVEPPDTLSGRQTSNAGPGFYAAPSEGQDHPLLDPKADVHIDRVSFAPLLGRARKQLVFSARFTYGGSGVPSTLAVVDVEQGVANLVYAWTGEGLRWRIAADEIKARSNYWTPADAHCCPGRSYTFTLAARNGTIEEIADERPFLGVLVRPAGEDTASLRVVDVDGHGPAAGRLQAGDVITGAENAPPPAVRDPADIPANSVYDQVARFDAGQTARLVVERGGSRIVVPVRLGSLRDPEATALLVPTDDYDVDAL